MTVERKVWLDALRGVTISLVVVNHCVQAMKALLEPYGHQLAVLITEANWVFGLVRMPAFFLCSGILFSLTAGRGWRWFVETRLSWSIWIIAIWTWISLLVIFSGVRLYPLRPTNDVTFAQLILIDPIGNIWFIYAIAILGTACMAIKGCSKILQITFAVFMSVTADHLINHTQLSEGMDQLLKNLASRGFVFFFIGFIFSEKLLKAKAGKLYMVTISFCIWALAFALTRKFGTDNLAIRVALTVAATFSVIYIFKYFYFKLHILSSFFEKLGRRSLQIFLLHQFFIAASLYVMIPLAKSVPAEAMFIVMIIFSIFGSYFLSKILEKIPGNPLFAVPQELRRAVSQWEMLRRRKSL